MSAEQAQGVIRNAFDEWARISPLQFDEVLPSENPTFRIGWFSADHGDGEPFDGVTACEAASRRHVWTPVQCLTALCWTQTSSSCSFSYNPLLLTRHHSARSAKPTQPEYANPGYRLPLLAIETPDDSQAS